MRLIRQPLDALALQWRELLLRVHTINNKAYRLPNELTEFQLRLYVHVIDWKWNHLTKGAGEFRGRLYDALLPAEFVADHHPLYPPIVARFLEHQKKFPFKSHKFFGHMASSQAACANLFLPLLQQPDIAARILSTVKGDLKQIATDRLDCGYRIEFWDEPDNMLGDHNKTSGTDSDIAIAYYDHKHEPNLWLIEHKLTEKEFTTCGGHRSRGRTKEHNCQSTKDLLAQPSLCYYQSACGYHYWDITLSNADAFSSDNFSRHADCPFKGGTNQLWRNYLLALAIENSQSSKWPYRKVFFSVVYHPRNQALKPTLASFQAIVGNNDRFFHFPSSALVQAAKTIDDTSVAEWVSWYEELYYF